MMITRLLPLLNNTVASENWGSMVTTSINDQALIKATFTDILSNMYVESCKNIYYSAQAQNYFDLASQTILS
jgi:hypothetical protein